MFVRLMRDEDMNKRGITLMELIIVMAIIAVGAVLMVPNIAAWLPNYRLKSATRDIVSTMRVAQMKAVTSNVQYRVNFNDVPNGYIIQHQTTSGVNDFVDEGGTQSLPSGITLDSITFGGGLVVFNPNSTASSGNMLLKNPKGGQKKITVLSTTGRVSVE
jgi:prepilin-type N-terminal cleavage/methylation domain-containing protein